MDNNSINSDLIRGHIDTIILKSLSEGDKYGYEISREIEVKSGGSFILKQPTLYSALKRLEGQNYITAYWGEITKGARRKYYKLTQEGMDFFSRNQSDWEHSRSVIDNLVSDKVVDIEQVSNQSEFKKIETQDSSSSTHAQEFSKKATNFSSIDTETAALSEKYSVLDLDKEATNITPKKYDAVIIRNNENGTDMVDLSHLSQVTKMPEELKRKIADKFNEAKSIANNRLGENTSEKKDLPDWLVKSPLNDANSSAISNLRATTPQSQPIVSDIELQSKVSKEQEEGESDKYKNKLIKIFDSQSENPNDASATAPNSRSSESVPEELYGHNVSIRMHSSASAEKDNVHYVFVNKFRVAHYSVLAFLIFCELLISHFVFNVVLKLNLQTGYFLSAGLIALALPFIGLAFYFYNPEVKKQIRFRPKTHFLKRLLVFGEIAVLLVAALLLAGINIFANINNFAKAFVPMIVAANILLTTPISLVLYKLKFFSIGARQ